MFNPLHNSRNQELFKNTSVIKVVAMKYMDNFCCRKEAIMHHNQIDTFSVSKDKWDTNEDTDKSMNNYSMLKGTSQTKGTSN